MIPNGVCILRGVERSWPDHKEVFERLEPDTGKLVRPVLRGVGDSNVTYLLDNESLEMELGKIPWVLSI